MRKYQGSRPTILGKDHNFPDSYLANRGLSPFILRYPTAVISLLMLIVTFNEPGSNWPVDVRAFDYHLQGNAIFWLFSISSITYTPLMLASIILFITDLVALIKNKTKIAIFNLVFFSTLNLAALYRFNSWIFEKIF